jgi:hypothetical protein
MTLSRITIVCGFLLHYAPSALGMMNHAFIMELLCLRAIYETRLSNNIILENYPDDVMPYIMQHLSLRDCAAFTATCKGLQNRTWFPGIAHINPDHIRKKDEQSKTICDKMRLLAALVTAGSSFMIPLYICKSMHDNDSCPQEVIDKIYFAALTFFGAGFSLYSAFTESSRNVQEEKDRKDTYAETDAYLTHAYHTLAERMYKKRIVPHTLKIHYHNQKQIMTILRAVKKCEVTNLTIYLCIGDKAWNAPCCNPAAYNDPQKNRLDLFYLLDGNTKLENLTLEKDSRDKTPLSITRLCKGISCNKHLKNLTLVNFSKEQQLLVSQTLYSMHKFEFAENFGTHDACIIKLKTESNDHHMALF